MVAAKARVTTEGKWDLPVRVRGSRFGAMSQELDAGIKLGAKREGFCTAVAPLLESLQREGFRIAPATFAEVLRLAGE